MTNGWRRHPGNFDDNVIGCLSIIGYSFLIALGLGTLVTVVVITLDWRDGPEVCLEWGEISRVEDKQVGWTNKKVLVTEKVCRRWKEK